MNSGEGRYEEDLRPAGGGRIPTDPAPLRRAQVPAGAQHHRGLCVVNGASRLSKHE